MPVTDASFGRGSHRTGNPCGHCHAGARPGFLSQALLAYACGGLESARMVFVTHLRSRLARLFLLTYACAARAFLSRHGPWSKSSWRLSLPGAPDCAHSPAAAAKKSKGSDYYVIGLFNFLYCAIVVALSTARLYRTRLHGELTFLRLCCAGRTRALRIGGRRREAGSMAYLYGAMAAVPFVGSSSHCLMRLRAVPLNPASTPSPRICPQHWRFRSSPTPRRTTAARARCPIGRSGRLTHQNFLSAAPALLGWR